MKFPFFIFKQVIYSIGCCLIFLGCSNKKVELKTKLELTAQTPKWSQLYVDINELKQEIQSIKLQIQNNKKEIHQKISLIEDSTRLEEISVYKEQYFHQLSEFNQILDKSKKLHHKYIKDRTLYNYWLNTVQNDVLSEEKVHEEYKIFEKKYENLRKEYFQLKKEFLGFIQMSNIYADKLCDVIPDLVGIKFRANKK